MPGHRLGARVLVRVLVGPQAQTMCTADCVRCRVCAAQTVCGAHANNRAHRRLALLPVLSVQRSSAAQKRPFNTRDQNTRDQNKAASSLEQCTPTMQTRLSRAPYLHRATSARNE